MEDNLNECTTGILIDLEDHGNITVEKSLVLKNDESGIDEFHLNLHEHTIDAEKEHSFGTCEKSICITDRLKNIHLGAKMKAKKEMLSIPRGGWKTPSPKSMNIIWKEASKIIDQLHSSPIESTEVLLVDEDFPVPYPLHKGCLDEFSPESEKISEKKEGSTEKSISELHAYCINADITPTLVLGPEISEPAEIQTENSLPENIAVSPKHSKSVSIEMKSKTIYGKAFQNPIKSIKMNKKNESEGKSCIDSDIPPSIVLEPEISEPAEIQKENALPKNIALPPKHSKPISQMKSKNMYGNAFKTPINSGKMNNENVSERMTIPMSDKYIFRKSVLGDSNKGIGILKSKPNVENSLKGNHTTVEASKIIDQLHSSPIESTEVLLVDEDLPVPFPLHKGCLDEFSPESEKISEKKEDSTEKSISKLHVSCINADLTPTKVLGPKISEPAEMQTENSLSKNIAVSPRHSKPISIQMKSKTIYGKAFQTPIKGIKMNKENESEGKSCMDADIPPSIVLEPEISEPSEIQKENSLPKNIALPPKHSKPISQMKSKNMYGNAFKTPIKSGKMNNENISERVAISKSDKNIFRKNVLGDSNKGIGILKSRPNVENSLKENDTTVITEKMNSVSNKAILHNLIGSNKRSSIAMPRTSTAIQYQPGSQQKQALFKTLSAVETPSHPKFIRRTNSFQSENGKYSVAKRLLEPSSNQESMSAKDSIKKTAAIKTDSSIKLLKSRMSICPIPSKGNELSTPLRRSNSLSKHFGTFSSQISRPSTSHKISSVAENGPQLSLLKRPVLSTSSRIRFCSRLDLPSTLPFKMNDNLPRKLFPDLKMPMKR